MDYISSFDIRLNKDVYYAGEMISGTVVLENTENVKIRGIRALLRGKAHAQLKVNKSGERRTVKDDQYLLDEKLIIWGKEKSEDLDNVPILPRAMHQLPFSFQLPECSLPCSLETKLGTIRYYIKVIIDIPFASSPQGIKYFTIIGPHIDCMDEKYLKPLVAQDRKTICCWCCQRGAMAIRMTMERSAYVCGENIRVRAQVENRQAMQITVAMKLVQYVEYFIEKGVLGESKQSSCTVLEHRSPPIAAQSSGRYDSALEQPIKLPVVPPTLVGVCRLMQIYYIFRVWIEDEKCNQSLHMDFPLTVATVPYRIPNGQMPPVEYDFCSDHVEGGKYISPEFRLGQVYDGQQKTPDPAEAGEDDIVLYRPVYARILDRDRAFYTPRYSRELDQPVILNLAKNGAEVNGSGGPVMRKKSASASGDVAVHRSSSSVVVDMHDLMSNNNNTRDGNAAGQIQPLRMRKSTDAREKEEKPLLPAVDSIDGDAPA